MSPHSDLMFGLDASWECGKLYPPSPLPIATLIREDAVTLDPEYIVMFPHLLASGHTQSLAHHSHVQLRLEMNKLLCFHRLTIY